LDGRRVDRLRWRPARASVEGVIDGVPDGVPGVVRRPEGAR
jgi:hypothetical protein